MTAPETGRFEELLTRVGADLDSFIEAPRSDPVATADDWTSRLDGPLPEDGVGVDRMAELLGEVVVPAGSRISDPGFWSFITAGPATGPVAAATAAMVASPQRYTKTAFNFIEEQSLQWLAALCGLAPGMKGVYSSGGSTANLLALGAARQSAYEKLGSDVSADGLAGRRGAIYTSREAHHTVQRAAGVLGMGRSMVRVVTVDKRQRLDVAALREAVRDDIAADVLPVAVVATAGTTSTGAIDPLRGVGEVAAEFDVWFHIDGAYGLPGILDDRIAERFDGVELADSVIVDPHKWLAAPVGVAATFVRDRSILYRAFTKEPADYLEGSFAADGEVQMSVDSMGVPYDDMSLELSAPPRGIMVWAILLEEGCSGLTDRIRRDNDRARRLTDLAIEHPRLEALTDPELSIACIRYAREGLEDLNDFNARLHRRLLRETEFLPSTTLVDGHLVIRPCFMNVRTRAEQVDGLATALVELGEEME